MSLASRFVQGPDGAWGGMNRIRKAKNQPGQILFEPLCGCRHCLARCVKRYESELENHEREKASKQRQIEKCRARGRWIDGSPFDWDEGKIGAWVCTTLASYTLKMIAEEYWYRAANAVLEVNTCG